MTRRTEPIYVDTNTLPVYGMGVDLATLLSVMGTVGVGNPLSLTPSFSIGGVSSKVSNILDNLLGLLGTYYRLLFGSTFFY